MQFCKNYAKNIFWHSHVRNPRHIFLSQKLVCKIWVEVEFGLQYLGFFGFTFGLLLSIVSFATMNVLIVIST